ncbi:MAG TPA: ATP-binding cassette domain-containing protein [Candidatus Dormibacteraeota bacterium]
MGALANHTFYVGTFQLPVAVMFLGLLIGLTYGLLAVGLVLVFRTNRIINFAHGEIGAFAGTAVGTMVLRGHVPYWAAFPVGLVIGALVGGVVEVIVVRRLRRAPRVMSIVATLGVATVLFGLENLISPEARAGSVFPQPPFLPSFMVGKLVVSPTYTGMLVLSPIVVLGLAGFLRWSRFGRALRASSINTDAARLAGIYAGRMSTLAWMIAGAISAFTAILVLPTYGFTGAESFGPSAVLRALAPAVLARMTNLPVALAGGIVIGEVEQLTLWNYANGSALDLVLFLFIVVALIVQPRFASRGEEKGSWTAVQGWRPLPEVYRKVFLIRNLGRISAVVFLVLALLAPRWLGFGQTFALSGIFSYAIAGLSLGVITGLAGQLSLGQFALAGIGAWTAWFAAEQSGNYVLGVLFGGLAGAVASMLIGLPALRIRGLMLAVTTLAFAFMTQGWLLRQKWALGDGVIPSHVVIFNTELTTKSYYYFALAFLLLAIWLSANIRRGGLGRIFIALRDNPENARAFSIAATGRLLQAFAVAGFLAGVAGGIFAYAQSEITYATFRPDVSINLVAMSVLGGLGILIGPLIGALYVFGLPDIVGTANFDAVALAISTIGWLLLVLYVPGGLAAVIAPLRDRLADRLAAWNGIDVRAARADPTATLGEAVSPPKLEALRVVTQATDGGAMAEQLLTATSLFKRYGGVVAVDDVSAVVTEGEIVGLIGPNGAGKTTFFELLSGFARPDAGSITYAGRTLSRSLRLGPLHYQFNEPPEGRAKVGLIRSFQDAALFPTLTVLEVVQLAMERKHPSQLLQEATGSTLKERVRRTRARELIGAMGLDPYRLKQVRELSTGTRRIVEITSLLALEPRLLLLDEPSSGIAQRETEALGVLLRRLRDEVGITLFVIEHDIPLIMGLADRIIAMESGHVIAAGSPREVREDPTVIESYLGGDVAAIQRSGLVTAAAT